MIKKKRRKDRIRKTQHIFAAGRMLQPVRNIAQTPKRVHPQHEKTSSVRERCRLRLFCYVVLSWLRTLYFASATRSLIARSSDSGLS